MTTTPNPDFHLILKELGDLHDLKNQDYANPEDGDPLFNLREVSRFGMKSSTGIWVRCTDKWCRFGNWYKKGVFVVASEKVEDTVKDLIVYLCLWLMEFRNEKRIEAYTNQEEDLDPDSVKFNIEGEEINF
jgi:hypothetical protein